MYVRFKCFVQRVAWTKEDLPGLALWAVIIGAVAWSFWGEPIPAHHRLMVKPFLVFLTLVTAGQCVAFAFGCEWYRRETVTPFMISLIGTTVLYLGIVLHACSFATYAQAGAYFFGLLVLLAVHDAGLVMAHGLHGATPPIRR